MFGVLGSVAAFTVTSALVYLVIVAAASLAGALTRGGRRERAVDAYEALAISRFTIPVSIIVPVETTGPVESNRLPLNATIQALLDLNYPELEVIIVAERVADASVEAVKKEWALEPKELFYRRTLATAPVHRMYASDREPRLILAEKAAGGRADALELRRQPGALPLRGVGDARRRLRSRRVAPPDGAGAARSGHRSRGDQLRRAPPRRRRMVRSRPMTGPPRARTSSGSARSVRGWRAGWRGTSCAAVFRRVTAYRPFAATSSSHSADFHSTPRIPSWIC